MQSVIIQQCDGSEEGYVLVAVLAHVLEFWHNLTIQNTHVYKRLVLLQKAKIVELKRKLKERNAIIDIGLDTTRALRIIELEEENNHLSSKCATLERTSRDASEMIDTINRLSAENSRYKRKLDRIKNSASKAKD